MARTREQASAYVIASIREVLDGTGGDWAWDDFISCPIGRPEFEAWRSFVSGLHYQYASEQYASEDRREFCSPEGMAALRRKLDERRAVR